MRQFLNTLYVTLEDAYLSLDGENVVVSCKKAEVGRVPFHTLDSLLLQPLPMRGVFLAMRQYRLLWLYKN